MTYDPTVIIDPTAKVDSTAILGHFVTVGPNTIIGPHAKIDNGASIGANCEIGGGTIIGVNAVLRPGTKIGRESIFGALSISEGNNVIGGGVTIGSHCNIAIGTEIGYGVFIGPYFCAMNTKKITGGTHGTRPDERPVYEKTIIGDYALIGGQVAVTPGRRIGRHAVIDQHTFVTKDVPANTHIRNESPRYVTVSKDGTKTSASLSILDNTVLDPMGEPKPLQLPTALLNSSKEKGVAVNDCHIHFGPIPLVGGGYDEATFLRAVEKYHIENAAVMPAEKDTEIFNEKIIDMAKTARFIHPLYWLTCDRSFSHLAHDVGRHLEAQEIAGLKFHGTYANMAVIHPALSNTFETLSDYSGTILVHCGMFANGDPAQSYTSYVHALKLALKYPKIKVILAHMGGSIVPVVKKCAEAVAEMKLKNVYLDTSGMLPRPDLLKFAVATVGPDRILFGSDIPVCSFNALKSTVLDADLPEREQEMILRGNFARLFPSRKI